MNIQIFEESVCSACTSRHLTNAEVTEHLCEVRNSMESIQDTIAME